MYKGVLTYEGRKMEEIYKEDVETLKAALRNHLIMWEQPEWKDTTPHYKKEYMQCATSYELVNAPNDYEARITLVET